MSGGLMQLIAYGAQDIYLTDDSLYVKKIDVNCQKLLVIKKFDDQIVLRFQQDNKCLLNCGYNFDTVYSCGHGSCLSCYVNLKSKKCPYCRSEIKEAYLLEKKNDYGDQFTLKEIPEGIQITINHTN